MLKQFDFLLPLNHLPPLSFTYPTCLQLLYSDFCCSLLSLKKLQYLIQIWVCLSCNSLHSVVPSFQVIVCSRSTVGIIVPHTWSKLPIHPGFVEVTLCLTIIWHLSFKSIPHDTRTKLGGTEAMAALFCINSSSLYSSR